MIVSKENVGLVLALASARKMKLLQTSVKWVTKDNTTEPVIKLDFIKDEDNKFNSSRFYVEVAPFVEKMT